MHCCYCCYYYYYFVKSEHCAPFIPHLRDSAVRWNRFAADVYKIGEGGDGFCQFSSFGSMQTKKKSDFFWLADLYEKERYTHTTSSMSGIQIRSFHLNLLSIIFRYFCYMLFVLLLLLLLLCPPF